MRRLDILDGHLYAPKQIAEIVDHPVFEEFFEALWYNYLVKPGATTSGPYWSERFNDNKAFNRALLHLSKAGWIVSHAIPMRNWSTIQLDATKLLKWVSEEELIEVRRIFKFNKYKMRHRASKRFNLTKTPNGRENVGLSRPGALKSGNNEFRYDVDYLHKYYDAILLNTTKGIQKAIDKHQLDLDGADYKTVAIEILNYHIYSGQDIYTLGANLTDSRGRAIVESLSKVFNPIGYKDARALIIGPEGTISDDEIEQIQLSVSELLGYRGTTIESRLQRGKDAIVNRELHDLDLNTEDGRKDLYENIWLERIYDMFDKYDGSNWNVPIELDATASVLQMFGTLLGDYKILDEVNVVNPQELKDAWTRGMPRAQFKHATTPLLYGSTQPCTKLWKAKRIKYTKEQIKIHKKEISKGTLATAVMFKDYIIENVQPNPVMNVKIMDEEFKVYCNKYMNVGDYVKKYPLYDTASGDVKTINHVHTSKVPDLEAFKRYFVTLLIHNLDSQICDDLSYRLDWVLPIYDAFIVMPWEAKKTRKFYAQNINKIEDRNKEILIEYFKSIGIQKTVGSEKLWDKIQKSIKPVKNFSCSYMALK